MGRLNNSYILPDNTPNADSNSWGKFISRLKQEYTPQFVKAQIEDRVGSMRNKVAIIEALTDMCNTSTARDVRNARRGL